MTQAYLPPSSFAIEPAIASPSTDELESISLITVLKQKVQQLMERNKRLIQAQETASFRINHLMNQIDELQTRLDRRDARIESLENQLQSQYKRSLRRYPR